MDGARQGNWRNGGNIFVTGVGGFGIKRIVGNDVVMIGYRFDLVHTRYVVCFDCLLVNNDKKGCGLMGKMPWVQRTNTFNISDMVFSKKEKTKDQFLIVKKQMSNLYDGNRTKSGL